MKILKTIIWTILISMQVSAMENIDILPSDSTPSAAETIQVRLHSCLKGAATSSNYITSVKREEAGVIAGRRAFFESLSSRGIDHCLWLEAQDLGKFLVFGLAGALKDEIYRASFIKKVKETVFFLLDAHSTDQQMRYLLNSPHLYHPFTQEWIKRTFPESADVKKFSDDLKGFLVKNKQNELRDLLSTHIDTLHSLMLFNWFGKEGLISPDLSPDLQEKLGKCHQWRESLVRKQREHKPLDLESLDSREEKIFTYHMLAESQITPVEDRMNAACALERLGKSIEAKSYLFDIAQTTSLTPQTRLRATERLMNMNNKLSTLLKLDPIFKKIRSYKAYPSQHPARIKFEVKIKEDFMNAQPFFDLAKIGPLLHETQKNLSVLEKKLPGFLQISFDPQTFNIITESTDLTQKELELQEDLQEVIGAAGRPTSKINEIEATQLINLRLSIVLDNPTLPAKVKLDVARKSFSFNPAQVKSLLLSVAEHAERAQAEEDKAEAISLLREWGL